MLTNLTLSDLIALRDYCHQESLGFDAEQVLAETGIVTVDRIVWTDRWKQCDKELSERVEKIFGE